MKTFKATVKFWHESFGGYDHCDGEEIRTVKGRNIETAERKLKKILDKEISDLSRSCWYDILDIEDENEIEGEIAGIQNRSLISS